MNQAEALEMFEKMIRDATITAVANGLAPLQAMLALQKAGAQAAMPIPSGTVFPPPVDPSAPIDQSRPRP